MISCPVCKYNKKKIKNITFNLKFSTASKKKNDKLIFNLAECEKCQNFFNQNFDNEKISYKGDTLNTFFSNKYWKKYEKVLSKKTTEIIKQNKFDSVYEFGCGDGSFIKNIKIKKVAISGFDLNVKNKIKNNKIQITNDLEKSLNFLKKSKKTILIIRHVIEHLTNCKKELFPIFKNLKKIQTVFIEVPAGAKSIQQGKFEDLNYDHVSYLSQKSLEMLMQKFNFKLNFAYYAYNNENLICYFSKKNTNLKNDYFETKKNWNKFKKKILKIKKILNYKTLLFWGAGGRCSSILSHLFNININKNNLFITDSDKNKIGKLINGYPILSPSFALRNKKIQTVIVGSRLAKKNIELYLNKKNKTYPKKKILYFHEM
jgi:hypothetical protein